MDKNIEKNEGGDIYQNNDWGKYIVVFFITLALFAIAGGLSNFFTNKKLDNIRAVQNKVTTDILSSETQFALLSELSCEQENGEDNLSSELGDLSSKIEYTEENSKNNSELIELKRYYTLLEIKDYLLTKKINEKCGKKTIPLLYFYTTAENCTECTKQGFVLTELRAKYPNLRVYSFDYNLDLSALRALIKIYKIDDTKLPTLIVNEKKITGFQTIEDLEKFAPELIKLLPKVDQQTEKTKTP